MGSVNRVAWMVWLAMRGEATLGDLALFYQAFATGQKLVRELLGHLGNIYYNALFLGDLFGFLDLEPMVLEPDHPIAFPFGTSDSHAVAVRFSDVGFRYPGSERLSLRNFNLEIPAGRIVAIVGGNGAGKSTLVNCLCGTLRNEAGSAS